MRTQTRFPHLQALTLVALAALTTLSGCGAKAPAEKPAGRSSASAVEVTLVSKADLSARLTLDAEVTSLNSPVVAAQVAGIVKSVQATPGAHVKRGELLAVIDSSDLTLAVQDAAAQVSHASVLLSEKERVFQRNEALGAKEYISQAQVQSSAADAKAQAQQVRSLQMRAQLAQASLQKTRVLAPFDATVMQRTVAAGSLVRAGDPLLTLWRPSEGYVRVRVPQDYAGQVLPGQNLTLTWAGQSQETRLTSVRPTVDPLTRSFEAQAEVPANLRDAPGTSLTAVLTLQSEPALAVPTLSVQLQNETSFVFVVKDGKAVRKVIQTGRQGGEMLEVLSGVGAGDSVVTKGAAFLRDGQSVTVNTGAPDAPAAQGVKP